MVRVLITQPLALGGSVGFFKRLREVDAWIALGSVQHTAAISNGDGSTRKTGQSHIRLPSGWVGLSIGRRMLPIWDTPFGTGPWVEPLQARVERELPPNQPLMEQVPQLFDFVRTSKLGESSFRCAQLIAEALHIRCELIRDTDFPDVSHERTERLVNLANAVGASDLVCGPGTLRYLDTTRAQMAGLHVIPARNLADGDGQWIGSIESLDRLD